MQNAFASKKNLTLLFELMLNKLTKTCLNVFIYQY